MNNCYNCHTPLQIDAAFCPECGANTSATLGDETSLVNENKFTSAIAPLLKNMDQGNFLIKPMQWLFISIAIILIIAPFATIKTLKEEEVFVDASAFALIISFFSVFMGWIGFQIWWYRQKSLSEKIKGEDEFKAIPLFSYFLQTCGEWYGAYIAIIGVGVTIASVFVREEAATDISLYLKKFFILLPDQIEYGNIFKGILFSVLAGFLILIFMRYIAEFIRAIAAIANNTKTKK